MFDNLYKFLTIFGLVIFSLSFFVRDRHLDELHNINKQLRDFSIDHKGDQDMVDYLEHYLDSVLNKADEILLNNEITESKGTEFESLLDNYNKASKELMKRRNEWTLSGKEAEKNLGDLEYVEKKDKYARQLSRPLLIFGTISMIVGFILWYSKHQIYIDAKVKREGLIELELLKEEEKKQIELKKKK